MDDHKKNVAKACLDGAESGSMSFSNIVGILMQEGFESYAVDFRRAVTTYYLPDGDSVELPTSKVDVSVGPMFDTAVIQSAIREAQQLVPGYTYAGFCTKVAIAGCASYIVSFPGRRALYIGRTADPCRAFPSVDHL